MTADEFIAYRKEQLDLLNEDYNKMSEEEKLKKIDSYNRLRMREFYKNDGNKYSVIRHTSIISPEYWEVRPLVQDLKKLYYHSKIEIMLYNTVKVDYEEYEDKKFNNNEWEG